MHSVISRRAFITGRLSPGPDIPHPPGAHADYFSERCTACGDCLSVCPEGIIAKGAGSQPVLNFDNGSCIFCYECVRVCDTGALSDEHIDAWAWTVNVSNQCLSMNSVSCRVCQDSCDEQAISFKLQLGGNATALIDQERCTGCGACIGPCPVNAIAPVRQPALPEETIR